MAEKTGIEWCDSSFNPWIGCSAISPGCANCYASTFAKRVGRDFDTRTRTSEANWKRPLKWERNAQAFQAEHGRRQRVFCASLADVFDNEVDPVWRSDLFKLICDTPNLDWLLLTKRVGNVFRMLPFGWQDFGMPLNVWLGATVVNQEEADRDIPKLLAVPAAVRFLSVEPMLGPIDVRWVFADAGVIRCPKCMFGTNILNHGPCPNDGETLRNDPGIDWVICGGESGHGARPMHPDWARSLRDQCAAAGVPFLFKQWGEWTPGENVERVRGTVDTAFLWDDKWDIHPLNLATDHGHVDDQPDLYRVGKKAAGRLLDGVEHNGFPLEGAEMAHIRSI